MSTIVAINNSADLLQLMRERLTEHGYTVFLRHPSDATYALICSLCPDLVILDLVDTSAAALLEQLGETSNTTHIPLLVMLAPWQKDDVGSMALQPSTGVLFKPFSANDLVAAIERSLADRPA